MLDDAAYYADLCGYTGAESISRRQIQYLDTSPKPFVVQIPLVEYFERVKRYKADRWQVHFMDLLQEAMVNRHLERIWDIFHAEAQLGKTTILSQTFPAWGIGHDPLLRFVLSMYNVTRSQAHSQVVIDMVNSQVHRDLFPSKDGWLVDDPDSHGKKVVSKAGWRTAARRELNDGQLSFNPVGLQSGITGSGFDVLLIDDPYKEAKEAFSATVRENMERFWTYTVMSRASLHSNIFGMFHRYSVEDFAGYLLNTGDFKYIRYASMCDGPFKVDATGQEFPDPLGREIGELISPDRRPLKYYEKPRQNNRVWLSMFQGRPSSEEGDFFNVGKLVEIDAETIKLRQEECVLITRSWDHAASEEEHAAYSVGVKMGIRANGNVTVFDMVRKRLKPEARIAKQKETAEADGFSVVVTVPNDPGAAGDIVVYHVQQELEDYIVEPMPTGGTKEDRARNFAAAVNSGQVEVPAGAEWLETFKRELRDFPQSDFKDIVDSSSDAYNHNYSVFRKGKLIKNYKPQRNLLTYNDFVKRFPFKRDGKMLLKIPAKWQIYVGLKLLAQADRPSAAVIAARASANSYLEEHIFVLGEYKTFDADYTKIFAWVEAALKSFCEDSSHQDINVWAHPESERFMPVIQQKLPFSVALFEEDEFAGIGELNWYLRPKEEAHPFRGGENDANMYILVPNNQYGVAVDHRGMFGLRQEIATASYQKDGKPTKAIAVLDCLRMITHAFRTSATPLTIHEEFMQHVPDHLRVTKGEEISPEKWMEMQGAHEIARAKVAESRGLTDEDEYGY